ncbi:hypothetical protein T4E_8816 [Trichinella pseudospiralis]|uniref:DUF5641 domain-containing protein n=1 Tax=Trichinella pseudospiralis TaxID=6337 RepID=A0A0V0YP03_TRIPS|nr:hypothetical protein T4E_8816 [Trichinella pseudospiralis]
MGSKAKEEVALSPTLFMIKRNWLYLQWRQSKHQYMVTLTTQWKWQKLQESLRMGDVILVKDGGTPGRKCSLGTLLRSLLELMS